MKTLIRNLLRVLDVLLVPFTLLALGWMRVLRFARLRRMPCSRWATTRIGVYPLLDHFYEPMWNPAHLRLPLDRPRALPGIRLDVERQRRFLAQLGCAAELRDLAALAPPDVGMYASQGSFGRGDAELLYAMLRHLRPRRMVEIGSGHSTLVALAALRRNERDGAPPASLTCIEPYPRAFLASSGANVVARKVEELGFEPFEELADGDVLFIDSSHMIRPQGDVLHEVLEILPRLRRGVVVHVHDIFTPRDYPADWIVRRGIFWNEQYLLEAFLSCNRDFEVLVALNQLSRDDRPFVAQHLPGFAAPDIGAGSFWMRRVAREA